MHIVRSLLCSQEQSSKLFLRQQPLLVSIGAYLDSAFDVNLLPTDIVFQLALQQKGIVGRYKLFLEKPVT